MTDRDDDQTLPRHPAALTPSGRVWEMVKHVAGKALKYAVFAGIVGGALFAFMTGPALGPLAAIVGLFSHQGAMLLMKPVLTTALTGAKVFAVTGGVVGAAVGATDAQQGGGGEGNASD